VNTGPTVLFQVGVSSATSVVVSATIAWSTRIRRKTGSAADRSSAIGAPVSLSAARIWSTLAVGLRPFRIAHAPATWGAANEVPLSDANPPPGTEETIDEPGASRLRKDAAFENDTTASSFVVAPTAIADEMHAGAARPSTKPLLPDEITVAMPADRRLSIAPCVTGWRRRSSRCR
jgi:hypothetical protein